MIRFGSMSTTLLLGALYGALFAALLALATKNIRANRFLAVLLVVIALQLFPYIIGYAGFYDAYPWLSYAPYEASLAFGPLLFWYVRSLSQPMAAPGWGWHFAPVAAQVAYYSCIFPMPLAFKDEWNSTIHVPLVVPLEQFSTLLSIAVYWALSVKHYRAYQAWLADSVSDREDHHIEWVRNFLVALGLTLVLWTGLIAYDRLIAKLNYFEQFPFYVWLAVLSYYLGTEGYRHCGHHYPQWVVHPDVVVPEATAQDQPMPADVGPQRSARDPVNWQARGEKWRLQMVSEGWWRDSELSLVSLSRKLGTNTSDLSRAINEGLGLNFNELVNRLRVEAVKQVLQDAGDQRGLLDIAFEAGFSSKASFNRCFKHYTGQTPSAYREAQVSNIEPAAQIIKSQ